MKISLGFISFILLILFTSCEKAPDKVVYVSKEDFTYEDQKNIGSLIKTSIQNNPESFTLIDKGQYAELIGYLNQHLGAITNTSLIKSIGVFNWDITIIQDDNMKTIFTTPGGHLYVYSGLLKFLSNESELVAVLAHEVNYADNEIVLEKMVDEYGALGISDLLFDQGDVNTKDISVWLSNLSFSTQEVLDADAFGIELICPFNYQANGIQKIIEMSVENEIEVEWLNRRPSAANRIAAIESNALNCSDDDTPTGEIRYREFIALLP